MIRVGDEVLESIIQPVWRRVERIEGNNLFYKKGGVDADMVLAVRRADTVHIITRFGCYLDTRRGDD